MFWALGQLLRCKEGGEIPVLREWIVHCGRQGGCGRGQDITVAAAERSQGCCGSPP